MKTVIKSNYIKQLMMEKMHVKSEILTGRGYFLAVDGEMIEYRIPVLEEFKNIKYDKDGVTCTNVKEYIAGEINQFVPEHHYYWAKAIPTRNSKDSSREKYVIICLITDKVDDSWQILDVKYISREVMSSGNSWPIIPGEFAVVSHFTELKKAPAEARRELTNLKKGRYIPPRFTFRGKELPSNQEIFNTSSTYSLDIASGWRNVRCHIAIQLDHNRRILSAHAVCYKQGAKLHSDRMENDAVDCFESVLAMADHYTDEEFNNKLHSNTIQK